VALLATGPALADGGKDSVLSYPESYFADQKPNTAYDMISRLPAFVFDDGATARGFAGTAGNVLIDGNRPTSKTDDLQSILKRIPAADVDHIDLIRGGAPGIDMQGQTVVANVVRKQGEITTVVVNADANIFADGHMTPDTSVEFTQHSGDSIYEGSVGLFSNYDDSAGHGYHNILAPDGTVLVHNFVTNNNSAIGGQAHGAVTVPLWGGQLKANLTLQASPSHDSLTYTSPGFTQIFWDDNSQNSLEAGVNWKGKVGDIELETLALQRLAHERDQSGERDPGTTQRFVSLYNTGESILRSTVRYLPLPTLTLETGAEGAFNYLDGKSRFFQDGVDVPLPSADAYVQEKRAEIFATATWKAMDDLMIEAGARAEYSNISENGTNPANRTFFYPKPRAVVTWNINPDLQARLRYENVVGQLDFNDFIAVSDLSGTGVTTGNSDIRPDQHRQLEFSLEQHFWGKGALVVTLMHEDIKDVVDFVPIVTPTSTFDAPGNIGNGHNNQIDIELTLPLDNIGLDNGLLKTSTIFRHFKVLDPETGVMRGISIYNNQSERPQDINITLSQDIPKWNSTWSVSWFNGWDELSYRLALVQHREVPPGFASAFWEYKPVPSWSLHFEVDNFIPFGYNRFEYIYGGPRGSSQVESIDFLHLQSQPRLFFQVRKTFG
jgi:hypothetical protein